MKRLFLLLILLIPFYGYSQTAASLKQKMDDSIRVLGNTPRGIKPTNLTTRLQEIIDFADLRARYSDTSSRLIPTRFFIDSLNALYVRYSDTSSRRIPTRFFIDSLNALNAKYSDTLPRLIPTRFFIDSLWIRTMKYTDTASLSARINTKAASSTLLGATGTLGGLSAYGTANTVLKMNAAGTGWEYSFVTISSTQLAVQNSRISNGVFETVGLGMTLRCNIGAVLLQNGSSTQLNLDGSILDFIQSGAGRITMDLNTVTVHGLTSTRRMTMGSTITDHFQIKKSNNTTSGAGGHLMIEGANGHSGGNNNGGNIYLIGGAEGGTGTKGNILLGYRPDATISGNVGIHVASPTARLHLAAVTAAAGTASLKVPSGTLMPVPEAGAIEADNGHIYWTNSSGTRIQLDN